MISNSGGSFLFQSQDHLSLPPPHLKLVLVDESPAPMLAVLSKCKVPSCFSHTLISSLCSRVAELGGGGGGGARRAAPQFLTFAHRCFARIIGCSAASFVSPPNHISVLSPLFVPFMYLAHSCCVRFLWALSKWFESLTCGFDLQPGIGQIFLKFGLATTVCPLLVSPLCWTSNGSFN